MMKLVGISVALALAEVLGFACLAQAAPLDLKQVAADAKWLVHVDVDAVRACAVVQKGWEKCMAMDKNAEKHLDMLRDQIGMDLRTDLHGLTFYGKEVGQHTGVLIVHAKADQHKLLEMAKMAPEYKAIKSGPLEIHTWTHKHGTMTVTVAGAFLTPDVMVFASCPEELKAALAVLAGKAHGVGPDSALAGKVLPGSTVVARATGIAQAKLPCKSPLATQIESARIAMGENNGESFFRAKANMTNTEVVGQIKTIIDGGIAMAKLHAGNDELGKKLIKGLKVAAEGKTLNIAWSASAGDVWAMMEKISKDIEAHHKKMEAFHHGAKGEKGHSGDKKGEKKAAPQEEF
jgi:hypothetical protein